MATTVGPARDQADNSCHRSSIASNVWLPVRRSHVGTSAQTLTTDAGYTTATDSRVDLPTASLLLRGRVHIGAVRCLHISSAPCLARPTPLPAGRKARPVGHQADACEDLAVEPRDAPP